MSKITFDVDNQPPCCDYKYCTNTVENLIFYVYFDFFYI
jgi:hypothetical protein